MASPLGRGLGSLIPQRPAEPAIRPAPPDAHAEQSIQLVPLENIRPNPRQPRTSFGAEGIDGLAVSIRAHGLLQPLILTPHEGGFQIVAGERRYHAAHKAGLKVVPAIIREASERQKIEMALVENLQRQDLNPLEEAEAYHRLATEFSLTQEQIAQRVGKSRSDVANTTRLRGLPEEAKRAILQGTITEGHAKVLLSIESSEERRVFLQSVLQQHLSVRASEALARTKRGRPPSTPPRDPDLASHEETLQHTLGTKVNIRRSGQQGAIVIHFFSREEFLSLLEQLTKQ